MRRTAFVSVVAAVCLPTIPAVAQQRLTLAAAQAEARQHAPERLALDSRVRGTEAIAGPAGRLLRFDPEFSASVSPGPLAGRPEESAWMLGGRWTVDISGSWRPRAQSATADVERTRFERDDGLRALDEQVAVAFADVVFAQRLVARSGRIRALQELGAAAEHRRLDVGDGTQLDADAADLDLAGARATEEQAKGTLATARVRLARFLGRSESSSLSVDDQPESTAPDRAPDVTTLVDHDPRVRAALAELDAARFEQQAAARMKTPMPTFGVDGGNQRREIPAGSVAGAPFANSLTALWSDPELSFSVAVPLPLFDRQREPRARATARILNAEAQTALVRAEVTGQIASSWETMQAARWAFDAVVPTERLIDRDAAFVDQAVQAGAFSALTRSQIVRRLEESGRRVDEADRDLRVARAAWMRVAGGVSP